MDLGETLPENNHECHLDGLVSLQAGLLHLMLRWTDRDIIT